MTYTYICTKCGCRYQTTMKVEKITGCRNIGCTGDLKRK